MVFKHLFCTATTSSLFAMAPDWSIPRSTETESLIETPLHPNAMGTRPRNDLYCVEWDVKLLIYHRPTMQWENTLRRIVPLGYYRAHFHRANLGLSVPSDHCHFCSHCHGDPVGLSAADCCDIVFWNWKKQSRSVPQLESN